MRADFLRAEEFEKALRAKLERWEALASTPPYRPS